MGAHNNYFIISCHKQELGILTGTEGAVNIQMNSSILKSMRHKVSADKNRYKWGNYDLDLTYITDRIIGTSLK